MSSSRCSAPHATSTHHFSSGAIGAQELHRRRRQQRIARHALQTPLELLHLPAPASTLLPQAGGHHRSAAPLTRSPRARLFHLSKLLLELIRLLLATSPHSLRAAQLRSSLELRADALKPSELVATSALLVLLQHIEPQISLRFGMDTLIF